MKTSHLKNGIIRSAANNVQEDVENKHHEASAKSLPPKLDFNTSNTSFSPPAPVQLSPVTSSPEMEETDVNSEEVVSQLSSEKVSEGAAVNPGADGAGDAAGKPTNNSNSLNKLFSSYPDLSTVQLFPESPIAAPLGAKAFATGNQVHFAPGRFDFNSGAGKALIGHELSHVIQQSKSSIPATGKVNGVPVNDNPRLENDADREGNKMASILRKEDLQNNIVSTSNFSISSTMQRLKDTAATLPVMRNRLAEITEGLDLENLSRADESELRRRIHRAARQDVERFRLEISTNWPDLPSGRSRLPQNMAHLGPQHTSVINALNRALSSIERHPNALQRDIRKTNLTRFQSLFNFDKPFMYYSLMEGGAVLRQVIEEIGDNTKDYTEEGITELSNENRVLQRDPAQILLSFRVNQYRRMLNLTQIPTDESTYTGGVSDDIATERAYPSEIAGPDKMVQNGTGTYTMRLDYGIAGADLLSQVAERMNMVYYRWEVYDVTDLYMEHIGAFRQNLESQNEGESTGNPQRTTASEEMRQMRQAAGSEDHETGRMAAAGRRGENMVRNIQTDFANNVDDLLNPMQNSDGTQLDAFNTWATARFNLATTQIDAAFSGAAYLLTVIADLMGGTFQEREVPFPDKEGFFMVRCVATPSSMGGDADIRRAPSAATKVVHTRNITEMANREVDDMEHRVMGEIARLQGLMQITENEDERQTIQEQLNRLNIENEGTATDILRARVAELTRRVEQETNPATRDTLSRQLRDLSRILQIAQDRESSFHHDAVYRPNAVLVSRETGQSYPLLLQLGKVTQNRHGRYHYRLSDVTTKDGRTANGYHNDEGTAATLAISQFARQCGYGRGRMSVRLKNAPFELTQTDFDCEPRGGAQAERRLEQVAMVLTTLGLFAVPGVGMAAGIIGAAVAANRILRRIEDRNFEWDTAAVTDVVSILGAAASGAASLGRARVVRTSSRFAVVADDADVVALLRNMNRTASQIELMNDFLSWGGYLMGTVNTLDQLMSLQLQEASGEISHAEARRRRFELVAAAIRDSSMHFASSNLSETATRAQDAFGRSDYSNFASRNYASEVFIGENQQRLLNGNPRALQGLLETHGTWRDLQQHLSSSNDQRYQDISQKLLIHRDRIVNRLLTDFDASLASGASTTAISDVDISTNGPNAGRNLLRAEAYMRRTYGPQWSELFRLNFYTEANRLTLYRDVAPMMSAEQSAAVHQRMTQLTEQFTYAKMLQHAQGNDQSVQRVEQIIGNHPDMNLFRELAALNPSERNHRVERLHHRVDRLFTEYQRIPDTEPQAKIRLAEEISALQIEANFYTTEAYIGPGAGRQVVNQETVHGHEAYQSALSQLEMIEHVIRESGGNVADAARNYELYKYMHRFSESVQNQQLDLFHDHMPRSIYRLDRNAAQNTPEGQLNQSFNDFMTYAYQSLGQMRINNQNGNSNGNNSSGGGQSSSQNTNSNQNTGQLELTF